MEKRKRRMWCYLLFFRPKVGANILGLVYLFNIREEATTETLEKAIANPAIMGGITIPAGTRTPAARGMPFGDENRKKKQR
jgi:hypothetical protein